MAATIGSLFHQGGKIWPQWLGLRGAGGQLPRPRVRYDGTTHDDGTSSRPQKSVVVEDRAKSCRFRRILSTNADEGQGRRALPIPRFCGPLMMVVDESRAAIITRPASQFQTLALIPGSRLGPYEILSLLGAGGMGEVYRARDPRLGRDVAIKVLPAAFSADPESPSPLRAGSARRGGAQSSEHPGRLRRRHRGRHDVRRLGAARGQDAPRRASTRTRCRSEKRLITRCRSRTDWRPRTRKGSSIAISSPRTSSSPPTAA